MRLLVLITGDNFKDYLRTNMVSKMNRLLKDFLALVYRSIANNLQLSAIDHVDRYVPVLKVIGHILNWGLN